MNALKHPALDATADRLPDDQLLGYRHADGTPMRPDEVRSACRNARALGYKVVPFCDDYDADGYCTGHEVQRNKPPPVPPPVPALRERRPAPPWRQVPTDLLRPDHPVRARPGLRGLSIWRMNRILVFSTLGEAEYPDAVKHETGLQWLLSISLNPHERANDRDVRRALRAFDLVGAEEDNHHPGIVRSFWLPVDPAHRVACQCKTDERTIVEPDGYTYTQPIGGPCVGCELQRMTGKVCAAHAVLGPA